MQRINHPLICQSKKDFSCARWKKRKKGDNLFKTLKKVVASVAAAVTKNILEFKLLP